MTETTDTAQQQPKQTKRQLVEVARSVALTGDWEQALEVNTSFLERFPRDAQWWRSIAINRLRGSRRCQMSWPPPCRTVVSA